ncbi:hypothetical protein [Dasania phycosphaerae]|nr:hypothetical protein [Dasania phycosphaerae]
MRKTLVLIFILSFSSFINAATPKILQKLDIVISSDSTNEAKEDAIGWIASDLTDNGDNSYGRQDFSYIIPHIDSLINLMQEEIFFFHVYHILTREYGVSCHIKIADERKNKIVKSIKKLKVNSDYYLHQFNNFWPVCSVN